MTTSTPAPRRFRGLAVGLLAFAAFMDLMDVTIVNVALPNIEEDVHATPAQQEWLLGGYVLAFAAILITASRLGDRYGRRNVFLVGIIGFTAASLLASVAQDGNILVLSRVIQGLFAGVMVPQLLSSVQALYGPKERAPIFGVIGMITALAAVIGPVLGGWLVTSDPLGGEWRSIFYINIPIGIIIAIAGYFYIPNTRAAEKRKFDIIGTILATGSVLLLVYPLVEGRQLGWPAWSFVLMGLAPVVLIAFIWYESKLTKENGEPLVPLHLFRSRGFAAGTLVQFFAAMSINTFFFLLTLYTQFGLGFEAITVGLIGLPFSIGAFVGAGIAAPLAHKLGRILPVFGASILSVCTFIIYLVFENRGLEFSGWNLVIPMAAAGVGLTLMFVPLLDLTLATVRPEDSGAASGVFNTMQQVGAAVGLAIVGVLFFDNLASPTLPPGAPVPEATQEALRGAPVEITQEVFWGGYSHGIWLPVIGYALCAAASLLLPRLSAVAAHHAEVERVEEEEFARIQLANQL